MDELRELPTILDRVAEGVDVVARDGLAPAMNLLNVSPKVAATPSAPEPGALR